MKIRNLLVCVAILVMWSSQCVQAGESKDFKTVEAEKKLENLSTMLARDEIGSIEVVWMTPTAVMVIPMSPLLLDSNHDVKLNIEQLSSKNKIMQGLISSLKNTSLRTFDNRWEEDLRWRVKFFAQSDGRTVLTLYFSGGSYKGDSLGVIDDSVVYVKGGLYKWLSATFSNTFANFHR